MQSSVASNEEREREKEHDKVYHHQERTISEGSAPIFSLPYIPTLWFFHLRERTLVCVCVCASGERGSVLLKAHASRGRARARVKRCCIEERERQRGGDKRDLCKEYKR